MNVTEDILEQSTNEVENHRKAALRLRKYYAGESFREMGVLILFFLLLETILQKPMYWEAMSIVAVLTGVGLLLWGLGLHVNNHSPE